MYNSWFKVDNMPMDFLSVGEVQLEMAAQTCMIDRPGADPKIFKGGGRRLSEMKKCRYSDVANKS